MPMGVALITGASSGIGRAAAAALATRGCPLILAGRSRSRLDRTAELCAASPRVEICAGDLAAAETLDTLARLVGGHSSSPVLRFLIHSAADLLHSPVESVAADDLRRLLEVNVTASFALMRVLTPFLGDGSDVVFVNSSQGVSAAAGAGPYAATKHALRALADSYRAEVNPRGIRVTSVYCGKTATEMQRRIYDERGEGAKYEEIKHDLMRPEDVAEVILACVSLPRSAEVTDVHVRPMKKT